MTTDRAAVFAAVFVAFFAGHQVGDYWVQSSEQANLKGQGHSWAARKACLKHVASYTVTTTLAVAAANRTLGLSITTRGLVAGQLISAVTHYWADRQHTLHGLAKRLGKGTWYEEGNPADGYLKGSPWMDQSFHMLCLALAALATAKG